MNDIWLLILRTKALGKTSCLDSSNFTNFASKVIIRIHYLLIFGMVLNLLSILDDILFVLKSILCLLILLNTPKMFRHIIKILIKYNLFRCNIIFRRKSFRNIRLLASS